MTPTSADAVLAMDGPGRPPEAAGGKAQGLAEIARAGLIVPPAWVVLPGADDRQLTKLTEALSARGITRVAVRSSAADEDGARHSFAGIHETELGVALDRLREAIARVAESPRSERAASYRRQHGLPAASGRCAVVVQEMVDAEWSGVAFGKGGGVLVEAVEGLGEVAVNGDATPEQLELVREGGKFRVTRRWPRRQPFAMRAVAAGTERVALTGARPELAEPLALEIAEGVAALERSQGRPLDVEWATRGGAVLFLQARPQTRPLEAGLPPGETWTRTNIRELTLEIGSAMSGSLNLRALDRSVRDFNRKMGVPTPDRVPLLTIVAGRPVANERMFCAIGDALGLPRAWLQVLQGAAGEGTNALPRIDVRKMLRRIDVLLRLSWFAVGAERMASRHLEAVRRRREARRAAPPSGLAEDALLARVRSATGEEVEDRFRYVNRVLVAFNQKVSAGAMALAAHPAPAALLARLIGPDLASVSTLQLEEQVEIARAMRRWDGARAFLEGIGPAHASPCAWARSLPPDLWALIERWLERYGHRCPYESELALPRTAEDLRLLAGALRPLVLASDDPEAPASRRARKRAGAAAAWEEAAQRCGRFALARVRGPARDLGRLMAMREELRSEWMRDWELVRRDLLELGRRLAERGRLEGTEEVFHLTIEELERALREPAFDARAAVARERARVAAWRRIEVPNRFTSEEAASLGRRGVTSATCDTVLRGTAVSPGAVEGRACVLRSPDDEAKLALGGILVTYATDPGWTPLFARAAGVVVELGGVVSHSATVAREYGLPCVSNVDGAVAKLRDGDLLRVDGMHGTVEILERG